MTEAVESPAAQPGASVPAPTQVTAASQALRSKPFDLQAAARRRIAAHRKAMACWTYAVPDGYKPKLTLLAARNELRALGENWADLTLRGAEWSHEAATHFYTTYKDCETAIHYYLGLLGMPSSLGRHVVMHVPEACAALQELLDKLGAAGAAAGVDASLAKRVQEVVDSFSQRAMEAQITMEREGPARQDAYWKAAKAARAAQVAQAAQTASGAETANHGDHFPYWEDMGPETNEDIISIDGVNTMNGATLLMADEGVGIGPRASYVCYAMGASPFDHPENIDDATVPKPAWTNIYREINSHHSTQYAFSDGFAKLDKISQTFIIPISPYGTRFSFGQKYNYEHFKGMCYLNNFPVPTQRRLALIFEDISINFVQANRSLSFAIGRPCLVTVTLSPTETGPDGMNGSKFTLTVEGSQPLDLTDSVWIGGCIVGSYKPTVRYQNSAFRAGPAIANSQIPHTFKYATKALSPGVSPQLPLYRFPLFLYVDSANNIIGSNMGPIVCVTYTLDPGVSDEPEGYSPLPPNLRDIIVRVDPNRPGMINATIAFFLSYVWHFVPKITISLVPIEIKAHADESNYHRSEYFVFNDSFVMGKIWGWWDETGKGYHYAGVQNCLKPFEDYAQLQHASPFERVFWRIMDDYFLYEKPFPEYGYPTYNSQFWEEVNLTLWKGNPVNWYHITTLDTENLWGQDMTLSHGDSLKKGKARLVFARNTAIPPISSEAPAEKSVEAVKAEEAKQAKEAKEAEPTQQVAQTDVPVTSDPPAAQTTQAGTDAVGEANEAEEVGDASHPAEAVENAEAN